MLGRSHNIHTHHGSRINIQIRIYLDGSDAISHSPKELRRDKSMNEKEELVKIRHSKSRYVVPPKTNHADRRCRDSLADAR